MQISQCAWPEACDPMTPDSRLLKNNEGNRDGVWDFCRGKEADIALFLQVKKLRQIRKIY